MITRDAILAAGADETLLDAIATAPHDQQESLATLLSELHNLGELDILAAINSGQLDSVSGRPFFTLQRVFCKTLPRIQCPAAAAVAASKRMFEKAGTNLGAGLVYSALQEWFQQSPERVEQGLALIRSDMDSDTGAVRSVLLAGSTHSPNKSIEVALYLSNQPQPHIRLNALWALGRILSEDDGCYFPKVLRRLEEVIDVPLPDNDAAVAIDAALHLLGRIGSGIVEKVEPLLYKACKFPNSAIRHTLAFNLQMHRSIYTEPMIDAVFEALQGTDAHDHRTLQAIDSLLYDWDLDKDRQRVFRLLKRLLCNRDEAIELETMHNFRHRLSDQHGGVLGWYVVSLLITAEQGLCLTADQLLPYQKMPEGLDIDLAQVPLEPSRVLFLARKILGYCLVNATSASALLLSCLRAVSTHERRELENLLLNYFIINYLNSIEWFESMLYPGDPAKDSVNRLSIALNSYLDGLRRHGICAAFKPSERERQLQFHRQAEFWRDVQQKAEENSILSIVAHKATILYGTASIFYVYTDESSPPHRQEASMMSHEHFADLPRLEAIDPVGLRYALHRFRSEVPPS